jgi:hypothetical protein
MARKPRNEDRLYLNKRAFDEVIGDPYSIEPIEGHYFALKHKSAKMTAWVDGQSASPATKNAAQPNHIDFFCDVDSIISEGLDIFQRSDFGRSKNQLLQLFDNTYWNEVEPIFDQHDRADLEQIIGRILRARKVSPVSLYFTTVKGKLCKSK